MKSQQTIRFERGVFTISLDLELIWGTLDLFGPDRFRRACLIERDVVIDRLLDLFAHYKISATWCIVGHLLLDRCHAHNGIKHPEIVPPQHAWCRDWFAHDPCTDEAQAPLFYGRSLVEKIRACPVTQEIGCHSFSHVIFDDAGCSKETAESEVAACVRLAAELDIQMRSFVFPRDRVGHLDVLAKHGFTCYRGPEPQWYNSENVPGLVKRIGHLWAFLSTARPPVVLPELTASGLWNIPCSMIYFPMHGLRRYIPLRLRVRRAIKGLNAAVRQHRIFHLWFHPTNMADEMEKMFEGLQRILDHADQLRSRNELVILPMHALAEQAVLCSVATSKTL